MHANLLAAAVGAVCGAGDCALALWLGQGLVSEPQRHSKKANFTAKKLLIFSLFQRFAAVPCLPIGFPLFPIG